MGELRNHANKRMFVALMFAGMLLDQAQAADLAEVYRLALLNDPAFEVARYTLKSAQEKSPQALAGLLPTISASGSNNITRADTQFSNNWPVTRDVHAWNWSLQLTQPLLRLQNFYAYDEAQMLEEQAKAQYAAAIQDLILRVSKAYFEMLSSQEGIKVGEAEIAAAEEQLNLAQKAFDKGVAAVTDVRDSKARVDLAKSHLVAAQSELEAKTAELARIVDDVPGRLAALKPLVVIPAPQPEDSKVWIDRARDHHPAVMAARYGLMVTEARVGKNRSEHAPTLDLVASYGENYSSGTTTMPTDFASRGQSRIAGIQFTVPLFGGGGTSARVAEAIANKYTAGAELELARRQAGTDARVAYAGVVNGLSQITALESAVESSQIALNGSHAGYKLGVNKNIDVLNAEQQLFTAKRDLVKARYETLLQALKLKAAAGILNEDEILKINGLLEH